MGWTRRSTCYCCWQEIIFQPTWTWPLQRVFTLSSHIKSAHNNCLCWGILGRSEHQQTWASPYLWNSIIIHQAAEKKIIHIHKFTRRELWSRWYKWLYGSHCISHSGLINSWTAGQVLLAAAHMSQLSPTMLNNNNNTNIKHRNINSVRTCCNCVLVGREDKKDKNQAKTNRLKRCVCYTFLTKHNNI